MRRFAIPILVLVLLAVPVAVWLGRDDAAPPERSASDESLAIAAAAGSTEAEAELERRDKADGAALDTLKDLKARGFRVRIDEDQRLRRDDRIERADDRASKVLFEKTPVDKAVDQLPLKKGPLHVGQWLMDDRSKSLDTKAERARFYKLSTREQLRRIAPVISHKVYARVKASRWNGMSVKQREQAVKGFYRKAEKAFAATGIDDLVLVVAPLTDRVDQVPPLAIGRDGTATLTGLGRGRSRLKL